MSPSSTLCPTRPDGHRCHVCGDGPERGAPWYCGPEVLVGDATVDPDEDGPILVPGFEIQGLLGAGGMGTVYLAHHGDHGQVALKVLEGEADDSRAARRFAREAAALQGMDLPGVVRVYETGEDRDVRWIAMEWVRGPSLHAALEGGHRLPRTEAIRIVGAVAQVLDEVHRRGLAHRDIKPSNLLLRTDGTPILADFGILRHLDDTPRTELTRRPVGTPAYMAPELLKSGEVDWVRADVYALSVVLARCLSGRIPQGPWDLEDVPADLRPAVAAGMAPSRKNAHPRRGRFGHRSRRRRGAGVAGGALRWRPRW